MKTAHEPSEVTSPAESPIAASIRQERDALAAEIQRARAIAEEVAKAGGLDAYIARLNVSIGQEQALSSVLSRLEAILPAATPPAPAPAAQVLGLARHDRFALPARKQGDQS